MLRLYLCKQTNKHLNKITGNQEHNLLLDCAFELFTYGMYVVKIVFQASSLFSCLT